MNKDDWDGIVRTFNFDYTMEVLSWLISRPDVDRGTVIRFVAIAEMSELAQLPPSRFLDTEDWPAIASRAIHNISTDFYSDHEFAAFDDMDELDDYEQNRALAQEIGGPKFTIPREVFAYQGTRKLNQDTFLMADAISFMTSLIGSQKYTRALPRKLEMPKCPDLFPLEHCA